MKPKRHIKKRGLHCASGTARIVVALASAYSPKEKRSHLTSPYGLKRKRVHAYLQLLARRRKAVTILPRSWGISLLLPLLSPPIRPDCFSFSSSNEANYSHAVKYGFLFAAGKT